MGEARGLSGPRRDANAARAAEVPSWVQRMAKGRWYRISGDHPDPASRKKGPV